MKPPLRNNQYENYIIVSSRIFPKHTLVKHTDTYTDAHTLLSAKIWIIFFYLFSELKHKHFFPIALNLK